MPSERVTVGKFHTTWRVMLDGALLWGGFTKKFAADLVANTLNAAFDKVKADARLAWTTKKPTELGAYVWSQPGEEPHFRIYCVILHDSRLWVDGGGEYTPISSWPDGHWLGPLPEIEDGDGDGG